MSNSLKEIITKLNAANDRSSEQKANPVYQITEILNSHLHTLQWVDNANTQLDSKLKQVEKQFKFHQGQQQHLHRLRTGRHLCLTPLISLVNIFFFLCRLFVNVPIFCMLFFVKARYKKWLIFIITLLHLSLLVVPFLK